ncbi:MAG TPA: HNH endonuclease signature motif containing protein [Polyangiaceae bacterium]|nr:HNH endonuclease signature motif containing protein [Polyangiaceae bacterium]
MYDTIWAALEGVAGALGRGDVGRARAAARGFAAVVEVCAEVGAGQGVGVLEAAVPALAAPAALPLDHVVPVVRGGSDDATNLATACEVCNREKGVIHLDAYLLHRELTGQGSEGVRERLSAALGKPLDMKAALEFLTWLRKQQR